jgi:ATP-binding cassette subfamily B protein
MSVSLSEKNSNLKSVLKIISPLFRKYRIRLLIGFFALVCVDVIQLIIPKFISQGVDSLAQKSATSASLLWIGGAIICAAACVVFLRFWWRLLIIGFSRILEKDIRDKLFVHILKMDQPFFERWKTGDLMAHSSNDLNAIQMACGMGLVAAVDAMVLTSVGIGFMVAISPKLTLYALMPMPLLAICTRVLSARLHNRFNLVQEQFALITEFARTTLTSIQLIQGYTLERLQQQRFARLGKKYVKSNLNVAVIQGALFPASTLIGNIGMLLVLYNGGILVMTKVITIGEFVAFITYMYMLIWPMMAVGWVASVVQRGMTSLRRIYRLLNERPIVISGTGTFSANTPVLQFSCRHLSFCYPDTVRPVLTDISLDIEPGHFAITGRTGSGKSTLCKLLLRMYPVERGCLFCNKSDVNDLSVDEIRKKIAYLPQETTLFSETIEYNIAFGRPGASQIEIEDAARAAAIHEEILQLPEGYATLIGERGVRLSGGQRQRLALARALLCNSSLLVIDDGLNAIDVETEQRVLKSLLSSQSYQSIIIVSHRINVLQLADNIIILDKGEMVARGNHSQLLEHPFYRAMVEKQQTYA